MPKVAKGSAQHDDYGPVESWHEEVDGQAIEFVTFKQDMDSTPMLKGLPNDQCSCPHWGYVVKGKARFIIGGEERTLGPGDWYLAPGGVPHHVVVLDEPCEILDVFTPPRETYR